MIIKSARLQQGPTSAVAVSDTAIAIGTYDNKVLLFDRSSHRRLSAASHDHLVNSCDFHPDGTLLATASSDRTARLWTTTGLKLVMVLSDHDDDVMLVRFSPSGASIATCSYDGTILITAVPDGKRIANCVGHEGLIERIAWAQDGRRLASCGTDGTIRIWNGATGACIKIIAGLVFDVDDIVHLFNDAWLAACDNGNLLLIGPDGERSIPAHSAGIKLLTRTGNRLLSIGYDQMLIVWTIGEDLVLTEVARAALPPQAWGRSGCLLADDKVIVGSFGSRYLIYDLKQEAWDFQDYTPSISLNGIAAREGRIYAVGDAGTLQVDGEPVSTVPSLCNAVALAGDVVLVAGQDGRLFDALTETCLYAHGAPINRIEVIGIASDGTAIVALGTYEGSIVLLSLRKGLVTSAKTVPIASSAVKGICHRAGLLFCGSADGSLVVVDAASGDIRARTENAHRSILNDVSFRTGGFVTVSRDRTMGLWDREGRCDGRVETRHEYSVKCVSSSDDGRFSATGSYGGTIDIFDHSKGEWAGMLRRPTMAGISSIAWCRVRRRFLAASYDGNIYEVSTDDED